MNSTIQSEEPVSKRWWFAPRLFALPRLQWGAGVFFGAAAACGAAEQAPAGWKLSREGAGGVIVVSAEPFRAVVGSGSALRLSRQQDGRKIWVAVEGGRAVRIAGAAWGLYLKTANGGELSLMVTDGAESSRVVFSARSAGKALGESAAEIRPQRGLRLRIERDGNQFRGLAGEETEREVGSLQWEGLAESHEVGLLMQYDSTQPGATATAEFGSFRLAGSAPVVPRPEPPRSLPAPPATAAAGPSVPPAAVPSGPQRSADGRFVDHGDGTITDTRTRLMWAKIDAKSDPSMERPTIPDLIGYVLNLRTGNHANWRFPTLPELQTLYEPQKNSQTTRGFPIHLDPIFQQADASLLSAERGGFMKSDWKKAVRFHDGSVYEAWPGYQGGHSVRPVRNL